MLLKQEKRKRRHKKVRAKISGTSKVPRLCVFKSNRHIYAQLIDDDSNKTLVSASDMEIKKSFDKLRTSSEDKKSFDKLKTSSKEIVKITGMVAVAFEVGKIIAQKSKAKKIEKAVFDRGGYKYHGRVKAIADGARQEGLKF